MTWALPQWLAALAAVPVLAVLWGLAGRRHHRALGRVFGAEVLLRVLPRSVRRRRAVRDLLCLLGLAGVVLALAEPRFGKEIRTLRARGIDLVIALDLSRSMDAKDVDPSRLERARREIADLAAVLEGDRVGLVVYAGAAYPRLPLTSDLVALQLVVSESTTDAFQAQGSNLAEALEVAGTLLSAGDAQAGKAVLVLSDGEVHEAEAALEAAQALAVEGIAVYAMGIGREPAPIPLDNGSWLQDGGQIVTSTPDGTVLKEVARATGGAYVSSVASEQDIEQLYRGEIRGRLRAVERSTSQRETWRSGFQWPLGVGTIALLLAAWLGDGRRLWGAAAVVLAVALTAPTAHAAAPAYEADQLFRQGEYGRAAQRLTELSLEHPDDVALLERLGAARYRAGDHAGAARAWEEADALSGGERTDALFNAGNAHYASGKLEDARARYDEVLEREPEHGGAERNRELVRAEIEERRKVKPPPPPKQGGDDRESDKPKPGQDEQESEDPSNSGEGSAEDGSSEPTDGEPGEGEPGSADGEPNSDGGAPPGQQGSGSGGPDGPESPTADLGEVQDTEDSEPTGAGGAGAPGADAQPITAAQAHRLLDAIEEGAQRVVVTGDHAGKPW